MKDAEGNGDTIPTAVQADRIKRLPYEAHVQAYPLVFLRSFGNIQADGIPCCFYPELAKINQSVRKGGAVE